MSTPSGSPSLPPSSEGSTGSVTGMRQSSRARSRSSSSNGKASRNAVAGAVTARGCISIASGEAVMRQLKTSESVARDIVHDVVEQGLATGDSLPSEAVKLEQYGVSPQSLREGLRLPPG